MIEFETLPAAARRLLARAYQDALVRGHDEELAMRFAWTALKRAGYHKRDGKWRKPPSGTKRVRVSGWRMDLVPVDGGKRQVYATNITEGSQYTGTYELGVFGGIREATGEAKAWAKLVAARRQIPKRMKAYSSSRALGPRENPGAPSRASLADTSILGRAVELTYETEDGETHRMRWTSKRPWLWWAPAGRALGIIDGADPCPIRRGPSPGSARAQRIREEFQGAEIAGWCEQRLPGGKLTRLGRAVSVAYLSNKRNGGGDGRMATYEHSFAKSNVVWSTRGRGARLVLVTGKRLTVNDRGIVY